MVNITESAGGIVLNEYNNVLVVSQGGTSWSLPKGHIEKGEDALTAAKREILEESGIKDLNYITKIGSYERFKINNNGIGEDKNELKRIHIFLFKTKEKRIKPLDKNNPEGKWVKKEEVSKLLTHEKDKDFFNKWLDFS